MFGPLVIVLTGLISAASREAQTVRIVSAASFQPRVAPDSVASVLGSELAPRAAAALRDENGALPFEVEGVRVWVAGAPAQLLYVSPKQINFLVPEDSSVGVQEVRVQSGSSTFEGHADIRAAAPAIFSRDGSGRGPGAVFHALDLRPGPFVVESGDRKQRDKRTRLRVYATGLRFAASESIRTDREGAFEVKARAVTSGREEIELDVELAGPMPGIEALDQVDVILPEELDGAGTVEFRIEVSTATSNTVTFEMAPLPASQIRLRTVTAGSGSVRGGEIVTAAVRLNGRARRGGLTVRLESDGAAARVPAFVQIPEGEASAEFPVQTAPVNSAQTVRLRAELNGIRESAALVIRPAGSVVLQRISTHPSSVVGGASTQIQITLSSGDHRGVPVPLRASGSRIKLPAMVAVPAGRLSTSFTVETLPVAGSTGVELTAEAGGVARSTTLTLLPAVTVTVDRDEITGGTAITGTARLNRAAGNAPLAVRLTSDSPEVQVPSSITIPQGRTAITFPVRTLAVNSVRAAAIAADFEGLTQVIRIRLRPAVSDRVESLVLSRQAVRGGERVTATIHLEGPAPFPAVTVFLGTGSPGVVQVPVVFYVPEGQTTARFTVTTSPGWPSQDVTISASSGGKTATAVLRVD